MVKLLSNCRSDVIWEERRKKGRWKALKLRVCDQLEDAWTKIQKELSMGATPNYIYKSAELEVSVPMVCFEYLAVLLSYQHGCNRVQSFQYDMVPGDASLERKSMAFEESFLINFFGLSK